MIPATSRDDFREDESSEGMKPKSVSGTKQGRRDSGGQTP
jgi:hypothetical protein